MKFNPIVISIILLCNFLNAQETFNFKYKLDYEFPAVNEREKPFEFASHYIPEKYADNSKNSLLSMYFTMMGGFTFLDGNTAIQIQNSDLDNNYVISKSGSDYYGSDKTVQKIYDQAIFKNFEREPLSIMGFSCNHYQLFITLDGQEEDTRMVFCVDETNEIDNMSFLFPKQEGKQIKGLILAVGSPEESASERIYLSKINKINSTIKFDLQKELMAYNELKDSIEKMYAESPIISAAPTDAEAIESPNPVDSYYDAYLNQPKFCDYSEFYNLKFEGENSYSIASNYMSNLCSYTYYLKKGEEEKYKNFVLKEIKGMKKNLIKSGLMPKKDAAMFYEFLKKDIENLKMSSDVTSSYAAEETVEAASSYATDAFSEENYEEGIYVSNYESSYKTVTPDNSSFAITSLGENPKSVYWKGIPNYCKNIDSVIPKFSNSELSEHAKNYAGQICDMYLGEFEGTSVWYKGTLDAIRAEQLYFINQAENISKKDQKLLNEFLNNLD